MTQITTTRNPVHPGAILARELDARDLTPAAAARQLGLPVKLIQGLLDGTASVTPKAADAFARVWGQHSDTWHNLQRHFDTHPKNTHGGRRPGAGRKATGKTSKLLRVTGTPEELAAIDAWLARQKPGTGAQVTAQALLQAARATTG